MTLRDLIPWIVGGGITSAVAAVLLAARRAEAQTKPAEPEPEADPPAPTPRPRPPAPALGPEAARIRGMGITIRTLNHTRLIPGAGKYDGPALVAWCLENNVRWVELLAAWTQESGRVKTFLRSRDAEKIASLLRDNGIKVGIWGWPDPVNDDGFRDAMTEAAQRVGAAWIKLNPEKPYTWNGPHSESIRKASAARTMEWARELAPVDVTSYGSGPKYHPSFPWQEFSAGARYGRPQWYDRDSDWTRGKVERFAEWWGQYFAALCPILSAVNTNTPDQIEREADLFLSVSDGPAFSYWDFYWAAISRQRTAAIRGVGAKYYDG